MALVLVLRVDFLPPLCNEVEEKLIIPLIVVAKLT
jgi:hypothetical protein